MDLTLLLGGINEFIINPLILLLFATALLVFFWGIAQFVFAAGNEERRNKGKRNLGWGILGMFIMVSVYGILRLILGTFGIGTSSGVPEWIFR